MTPPDCVAAEAGAGRRRFAWLTSHTGAVADAAVVNPVEHTSNGHILVALPTRVRLLAEHTDDLGSRRTAVQQEETPKAKLSVRSYRRPIVQADADIESSVIVVISFVLRAAANDVGTPLYIINTRHRPLLEISYS